MKTKMQLLEAVHTGMQAQGRKMELCRYLDDQGLRCGVGHLLPEDMCRRWDQYNVTMSSMYYLMEDLRQGMAQNDYRLALAQQIQADLDQAGISSDPDTLQMLRDIQVAHDGSRTYEGFMEELEQRLEAARIMMPA